MTPRMTRVNRQDVVVKGAIVTVCGFVTVTMLWGWYYEVAVLATFAILGWFFGRRVTTHRGYAAVGIVSAAVVTTAGVNRLKDKGMREKVNSQNTLRNACAMYV